MSKMSFMKDTKTQAMILMAIFVSSSALGSWLLFSVATDAFANEIAKTPIANALGSAQTRKDFSIGSWFRYDAGNTFGLTDQNKIYIITTIKNITSSGNYQYGDPLVTQKIGDVKWYVWDIKVYWMDGSEAFGLYNKTKTGITLWDNGAFYLYNGYKNRFTYTSAQALNASGNPSAYMRPMFVDLGTGTGLTLSSLTSYTTGSWAYRVSVAGKPMFSYGGTSAGYDKDTGILFYFNYGTEWCLTQFSIKNPINLEISVPEAPQYEMIPQTQGSIDYLINFENGFYDKIEVQIVSNNTLVVKNSESFVFDNKFLINAGNVSEPTIVKLNISARVVRFGEFYSSWNNKSYEIFEYPETINKIGNTTIISFEQANNTIYLEWNSVANASGYRVYMNDYYIGSTTNTTYQYHPNENGTYTFYVKVDSIINDEVSDPSNTVIVYFGLETSVFSRIYSPISEEAVAGNFAWIWIIIIGISFFVALYILDLTYFKGKLGISKPMKKVSDGKKNCEFERNFTGINKKR